MSILSYWRQIGVAKIQLPIDNWSNKSKVTMGSGLITSGSQKVICVIATTLLRMKNVYIFWNVIKIHCGRKLIKMKKGFPHFCIPSFVGTIMLKGGEWRWKQLVNIDWTCKRIVECNFNTEKQHDIWLQKSILHLSFGAMRHAT